MCIRKRKKKMNRSDLMKQMMRKRMRMKRSSTKRNVRQQGSSQTGRRRARKPKRKWLGESRRGQREMRIVLKGYCHQCKARRTKQKETKNELN